MITSPIDNASHMIAGTNASPKNSPIENVFSCHHITDDALSHKAIRNVNNGENMAYTHNLNARAINTNARAIDKNQNTINMIELTNIQLMILSPILAASSRLPLSRFLSPCILNTENAYTTSGPYMPPLDSKNS